MDEELEFNPTIHQVAKYRRGKIPKCQILVDKSFRKNVPCGRLTTDTRVWGNVPLHFCHEHVLEWDRTVTKALTCDPRSPTLEEESIDTETTTTEVP